MMAIMLLATLVRAIIEEEPLPFFAVFFSFVIILGFVGLFYDHKLEEHKLKILYKKIHEQEILLNSVMESNNLLDITRQKLEQQLEALQNTR